MTQGKRWTRWTRWAVFGGVIVLAILAVGAALVVRDRRAEDDADTTASSTAEAGDWFGAKLSAACPALRRVRAGTVYAYVLVHSARLGVTPWPEAQSGAAPQLTSIATAYRDLLPLANATGQAQLNDLIAFQNQLASAVLAAPSPKDYNVAVLSVATPERMAANAVVLELANGCVASS